MTYRRFEARLERLERGFSEADSLLGEGLAALLAYARRHPQAEAEDRDDEDDEDETPTGLGLLLREAQPWIAQGDQDAPGDQEPRQGPSSPGPRPAST